MRFYIFLLIVTLHTPAFATAPEAMSVEEAAQKHLLLAAPFPDYPYEARVRHKTGSGLYELKFDYDTGQLREVHIVKSIGDNMLDGRAIGAFKLWKAKPRSIHVLRVPITFTMTRPR
jgi:TonB family protein